jgi:hypothetical protein
MPAERHKENSSPVLETLENRFMLNEIENKTVIPVYPPNPLLAEKESKVRDELNIINIFFT